MATPSAIHGVDLLAFCNEGSDGQTRSVIVEARRPPVRAASAAPPRLTTSPRALLPAPVKAGAKRAEAAAKTKAPLARAMDEVEQALKRLGLEGCARRNDLSGSFVVKVTPRQLRELAATPAVQAIRPNRMHRKAA
jgi:uncharacterized protein YbjT (DUF2867 family)